MSLEDFILTGVTDELLAAEEDDEGSGASRCGARLGGTKSNAINLILRLFLYHFFHTMSSWHHESIHNNTNKQQTPPPW
jgi:hypothetical protein